MKTSLTRCILLLLSFGLVSGLTAQTVYWGDQPGQGDFDGSLNGWTSEVVSGPDTAWTWIPNGLLTGGFLEDQDVVINSPTASNGAASFNMDAYTIGPDGPIPPAPYPEYVVDLISPTIDLSSVPAGTALNLEFYQLYKWFQIADDYDFFSSYSISLDNGISWTDPIDANPNVPMNFGGSGIPPENGVVRVAIPYNLGAAGVSTVKVKFTVAGNFYYWAIDDVSIISRPVESDLTVAPNWYTISPNKMIPLSQVEEMGFMTDVGNIGGLTAEDVILNLSIEDPDGEEIYSVNENYGTITIDSLDENRVFGSFTPTELGEYTGTYNVSTSSVENDTDNNTLSFDWEVTESTFAKEDGATREVRPLNSNWDDGIARSWAYGNHFYVTNGSNMYANHATFFLLLGTNQTQGINLSITLYKWNAPVNDWMNNPNPNAGNYNCPPTDREVVGRAEYEIQGNENLDNPITVNLRDELSLIDGVPLEDNTHYILMVEFLDLGDPNIDEVFLGASEAYNYQPSIYSTQTMGQPRFAAMLGLNTSGALSDATFSVLGFGQDIVPTVRMEVEEERFVNVANILNDAKINVFPSPANESVSIDFVLAKKHSDVSIRVLNSLGELLSNKNLGDFQSNTVTFNSSKWASGSYFIQLVTEEGTKTEKFIIQH